MAAARNEVWNGLVSNQTAREALPPIHSYARPTMKLDFPPCYQLYRSLKTITTYASYSLYVVRSATKMRFLVVGVSYHLDVREALPVIRRISPKHIKVWVVIKSYTFTTHSPINNIKGDLLMT